MGGWVGGRAGWGVQSSKGSDGQVGREIGGSGRGEELIEHQVPGVKPLFGAPPVLHPPPTMAAGGGGRFGAAPSRPKQMWPVSFREHRGKQMQGKWAAFPDPHVLVPSPPRTLHKPVMVLCHLGCRWPHRCGHGDSGLDWAMRVTVVPGPGHLGAHAVRAALNESHSAAGFLGACPQSCQPPSLTYLPLCVCPCPGFRRNLKGILAPEMLRSTGRETAAQRAVVTGYKGS